ncbi:hypothetical protein [Streptomyces sp. 8N616]|uniref:hypothetical protein n=1 Tax=Streptomyces sp. 8N616 TaxID=3457414 RepID=UPI003FCEF127
MGHGKPRPKDWHPLATGDRYSDPTPGDVEDVRSGQKTMHNTASEIREQIKRLKTIGEGEGLKGKYVDELKDGADKLKAKLEKTAGRYERVSAKLKDWADKLEHAQSETEGALTSAQAAEETIKGLVGTTDPDSEAAKRAEEELDAHQKTQLKEARDKLDAARSRFNTAVGDYESDADDIAGKIREIIDDAIEDGFWSWTSNWIERNLDTIKAVLEVLGWIATIAALAALVIMMFATAPWLLALAPMLLTLGTAVTVVTTASHVLMALTGNGGWGDVALDILSLATMRVGSLAAKGIKAGATAAKSASVKAARQEAKSGKAAIQGKLDELTQKYNQAKSNEARKAIMAQKKRLLDGVKPRRVATNMPKPTPKEILKAGGDPELAAAQKFAQHEAAKRGGDAATQEVAQKTARSGNTNLGAFGAGTGIDVTDKAIGKSDFVMPDKPSVEPYDDAKDWNLSQAGWYDYAP